MKKRRFILDDSFFHFCSRALYLSKWYQPRLIRNTSFALISVNIFMITDTHTGKNERCGIFVQKKI